MKHFFYIPLSILFLIAINNETFAQNINADTKLIFTRDSGFVTMKEGMAFLLANSLIDTAEKVIINLTDTIGYYKRVNSSISVKIPANNDTIGKYYRMENGEYYIVCLVYYSSSYDKHIHSIIEVSAQGELIKSEKFYLGKFPNEIKPYDNFYRYGYFFALTNVNRHFYSQHSYGNDAGIYLFKEVLPRDSITYIPLFNSYDGTGKSRVYSASMKIQENKLTLHYRLNKGEWMWIETKGRYSFTISQRKKLTIKYHYQNGKWTANKCKIKRLDNFIYLYRP